MALSSSLDYKVPLYSTSNFIKDSFGEHLLNENQENFSICIDRSIKDRRKIQINKALKEFDRKGKCIYNYLVILAFVSYFFFFLK